MGSQELKSSAERVGQLYPILVDYYGNIIDGKHRFSVDPKWKKIRLEHVKTDKDRLIVRIVGNTLRRTVSSDEKRELLGRLGEICLGESIELGKIAYEIAEETGMSYTWVMKYLPDRFKDNVKSENARATRRVATEDKLTELPHKNILTIQKYRNTKFVNVLIEQRFYNRLERLAKTLETTPDVIISNALLLGLKNLEEKTKKR